MKKLLCLLLVLFLIPGAFLFSACAKDESYKLSNMQKDLLAIADDYKCVVAVDNKLKFDYSEFKVGERQVLANNINNLEPYTNVKLYNQVFDNLMAFTYEYAGICSNDSFKIDAKVRNDIKTKIDDLSASFEVIDINVRSLADIIITEDNSTNDIYISRLNNVLKSYGGLFKAGTELTNVIADLYFNKILYNSNPDISDIALEEFNSTVVVGNLNARVKNAISLLTQNYVETYISNEALVNQLLTNNEGTYGKLNLEVGNYKHYVTKLTSVDLTVEENVEKAIEAGNIEHKKQSFYEKAIEAYNEQEIVQNDRKAFLKACKDVDYLKVKSEEKSSAYEKICVQIIDDYAYITNQYCSSLGELLDIING